MNNRTPPRVDCDVIHPGLPVTDVTAAVEYYTDKLGFTPGFTWGDPPEMAGVNLGRVSLHLMHGTPNPNGVAVYFVVEDADELYNFQRSGGVSVIEPPGDRPYGLRDYRVRDLYGYELAFGHHLMDTSPPLEIERVDVPVRIEKRLAALLADLAAHKRMSVSSCLEETLLHSFEPLADGVASPHTRRTLRYIEELKRKHGIDYDCHASYRFVERSARATR